jgi:hypothetical protein
MEATRTQIRLTRHLNVFSSCCRADSLRSQVSSGPYTTSRKSKENELTHRFLERDQVR